MRRAILSAALALVLSNTSTHPATAQDPNQAGTSIPPKPFSWPLQLEMRVPFAPTLFLSGEKSYLFYELYLTNFSATPINLIRIEVVDADARKTPPVATLEAEQLGTMLQPIGRTVSDPAKTLTLAGGESSILFMRDDESSRFIS